MSKEITVGEWIAIRDAGRKIDPETAKVCCRYTLIIDPYGIDPDLPKECEQVRRDYFARAPGSDIWVGFGDLPKATVPGEQAGGLLTGRVPLQLDGRAAGRGQRPIFHRASSDRRYIILRLRRQVARLD